MNDYLNHRSLVTALLLGAVGIALLWAGGVDFPIAVPPGMVILVVGAAVVAAARQRWTAWLGCALGLFVVVGFIVSGVNGDGFDNLLGRNGATIAIGQAVQLIGVSLAVVVGAAIGVRGVERE